MSDPLILASVTAVLKNLLENGLAARSASEALGSDAVVSALPPDRIAAGPEEKAQINVFLYQAHAKGLSAASRHGPTGGADPAAPPRGPELRSLEMHYLLTAYGMEDLQAEVLLGYGMALLADRPVLGADEFGRVLAAVSSQAGGRTPSPSQAALAAPGLGAAVRRVKVCPQALETEEMVNLWSSFQVSYRPSLAYHVSVELTPGAEDGAR